MLPLALQRISANSAQESTRMLRDDQWVIRGASFIVWYEIQFQDMEEPSLMLHYIDQRLHDPGR